MQRPHIHRNRILAAAVLAMMFVAVPTPAHAVSKEIIALQTQVQQLLDMVQRLQSTLDTRFGVLTHLQEQASDDANRALLVGVLVGGLGLLFGLAGLLVGLRASRRRA